MPSAAQNGLLFEAGCQGRGTFVGIVNNKFRVLAGDGGDAANEGDVSDKDTAVLSIPLTAIPLDGQKHEVGVFVKTSAGEVSLWIDGAFVGKAQSTENRFERGEWTGSNQAGFG